MPNSLEPVRSLTFADAYHSAPSTRLRCRGKMSIDSAAKTLSEESKMLSGRFYANEVDGSDLTGRWRRRVSFGGGLHAERA